MNTDQQIDEIMVHLEDLSGEKLDWAIESKWKNHAIIPVESLERIALHLQDLLEIERLQAKHLEEIQNLEKLQADRKRDTI